MILFVNVFMTNNGLYGYARHNLPRVDRGDILLYSLASYASIDRWTKCIFYLQLDNDFLHKQGEFEQKIHEMFGKKKCSIYWHRNVYTRDWRKAAEEVLDQPDELIWLTCNHDHPFIDYDQSMIDEVIDHMTNEKEKLVNCYWSHWPEIIRVAALESEEKKGNYLTLHWNVHDAIHIVNKNVFYTYFFDYDFGDRSLTRLDVIHDYTDPKLVLKTYIPTRELCRHFDGYSHVNIPANVAPPLTIPPGFFEKDMKVLCYANERREGWVNINPLASEYFAHSPFGTDDKIMLEDLPLFWRDRITQTEIGKKVDRDRICQARNEAYLAKTTAINSCYCRRTDRDPPVEWFKPHMRH